MNGWMSMIQKGKKIGKYFKINFLLHGTYETKPNKSILHLFCRVQVLKYTFNRKLKFIN